MASSKTLLLHIEDDVDDALLIRRALDRAEVQSDVRVAENGDEAARYLSGASDYHDRSVHPMPDLILLDLNMPIMDGFEFLRWRSGQPTLKRIPVVVLTSSSSNRDISSAYDSGANAYLVKPLSHDDMLAMLIDLGRFWLNWNRTVPSGS